MEKVILFGAGTYGKQTLDFLRYCNLDSCVYAVCDNDLDKTGGYVYDKPII